MGFPAENLLAVLDPLPLGFITQSPANIELLTKLNKPGAGRWMACDGGDRYRGQIDPLLASSSFPAGVFTTTARTLAASPVVGTIVADTVNFLMPGAAGTSPIQATADMITFQQSATWTAATSPASIIVANTRWVMSGSGGDLTVPYVINTGGTATALAAKANWTVTTSGSTSTLAQALSYSSSLALTLMVPDGAGTTVYTLPDGSTAWTSRTTPSATHLGCAWTGQKGIITTTTTSRIQTSTDFITWTDVYLPHSFTLTAAGSSIASDGNGTVIICSNNTSTGYLFFLVSNDHGTTWKKISLPNDAAIGSGTSASSGSLFAPAGSLLSYVNGKFFLPINDPSGAFIVSAKGIVWQVECIGIRGVAAIVVKSLAWKANVYAGVTSASTAALSSTEDMSQFRITASAKGLLASAPGVLGPTDQMYMKVQS